MVLVGSVCIDQYEARLVRTDGSGTVHPPNRPLASGVQYQAESRAGVLPQGYISRDEASAACQAAGKRLCSAVEWQRACKGDAGYKYPYGKDEVKHRCNNGKVHLPSQFFGPLVTSHGEQHLNDPRLNLQPGFLAKTAEYSECVSDRGVFDMVGNLHEWVADDVNGALPKKIPITYGVHRMGQRGNGVFMGGYFSSQREHGRGCEYATTHHAPGYHDYSIGFRCCAEPGAPPKTAP
jgi:formylglycine-generating enzyme required for sulfatase activity